MAVHFSGIVHSGGGPALSTILATFTGQDGAHVDGQGNLWFVDGDLGDDANHGHDPDNAKATIQAAVTAAQDNAVIYIKALAMAAGATDPSSYTENIIIPATHASLALVGIPRGRTQGGLPQLKVGTTTTSPLLTIRAPGCYIANLGFNGAGATGSAILLDDDGSTKTAFGTTVEYCHFKNCKGTGHASTGGAVVWSASGGAWQVLVRGCRFYKCIGGVVLLGTGGSRPQDIVIEDCVFGCGANTGTDCDIYLAGGSGAQGAVIRECDFTCVGVPAGAGGGTARYISMTGCTDSAVVNCRFACTGKTFGAAGNAALIPTTTLIANCYQEDAIITRT